MPPLRRVLIWLALASPVSKLTLYCLDLVVRHWRVQAGQQTRRI